MPLMKFEDNQCYKQYDSHYVRAAMYYGFVPFVASFLQLLIRWNYNPKTYIVSYFIWLMCFGLAFGMSLGNFDSNFNRNLEYIDITCVSVIFVYLISQLIIIGRVYRKLMMEEEVQKSMRSTLLDN